jgi:hypothetical protein
MHRGLGDVRRLAQPREQVGRLGELTTRGPWLPEERLARLGPGCPGRIEFTRMLSAASSLASTDDILATPAVPTAYGSR